MMSFASIDLALFAFVALAGIRGAWRGFFREVLGLAAVICGSLAAYRFTPALVGHFADEFSLTGIPEIQRAVGFVLIFGAVSAILGVAGYVLERSVRSKMGRLVSGVFGVAAGGAKGVVVCTAFLLFFYLFAPPVAVRIDGSRFARILVHMASDRLRVGLEIFPQSGKV